MNKDEFLQIVGENYKGILRRCKNTIRHILKTGRDVGVHQIEDFLNDVIISTAEKIEGGKLDLKTKQQVINYLRDSTWYSYKNKSIRDPKAQAKFDAYSYQAICHPEESSQLIVDSTQAFAKRIDEYLLANYSFVEFGLFKTYAMGEHSYEALAELTGFSDTKCWLIVKKIREDLVKNADKFLGIKQNEE